MLAVIAAVALLLQTYAAKPPQRCSSGICQVTKLAKERLCCPYCWHLGPKRARPS
jgi:hypothetical protein